MAGTLTLALGCLAVMVGLPRALQAQQLRLWAIDDMVRINPETGKAYEDNPQMLPGGLTGDYRSSNWIYDGQTGTVRLHSARNEVVAFQVIIEGRANNVTVDCTDLTAPGGAVIARQNIHLFRQWYVRIPDARPGMGSQFPLGPGWYPDALIPLDTPRYGNGFDIPSADFHDLQGRKPDQKNQAIWVDLFVPPDAQPGRYRGQLVVKAANNPHLQIDLQVWDFALPPQMHVFLELMCYGTVSRQPDRNKMLAYYRLAQAHRTTISDNKVKPAYNGKDYDWSDFDARYGELFDGRAFTDGPCAGVPLPFFIVPVEFGIRRPDKTGKSPKRDWPIPSPKTPSGCGVQFTDRFKADMLAALKAYEAHFIKNGWTHTQLRVFQDSLDEPGFHKSGRALQAGKEQAKTIYEMARLIATGGFRQIVYKLDIGGGFARNRLDLDADGKLQGPADVANYFAGLVGVWSIHGLCIDVDVLRPQMQRFGTQVQFYNGYEPRAGPNAINAEALGFRTWPVLAFRSGIHGAADWHFARDNGKQVFYEPNSPVALQRNLYIYDGAGLGMPDRIFPSIRLKSLRRGAQDYEYLWLLSRKDGNNRRAMQIAQRVVRYPIDKVSRDLSRFQDDRVDRRGPRGVMTGRRHWSHHPAEWERFRQELGRLLSR